MTPVSYDEILQRWLSGQGTSDLYCLPKPPYRPMRITWISGPTDASVGQLILSTEPPVYNSVRRTLTADEFNALGYIRYEENLE